MSLSVRNLHPDSDLKSTTEIETFLGVDPVPLLREHPSSSLFDAARRLIETHARRLPLLDNDTETGHEVIVSVLTQYRMLKFIAINVSTCQIYTFLHLLIEELV